MPSQAGFRHVTAVEAMLQPNDIGVGARQMPIRGSLRRAAQP